MRSGTGRGRFRLNGALFGGWWCITDALLLHLPQEEASHTSRPLNGTSEGA